MDNEIKKMNFQEFRDLGYLQEVNRQFFHPLGLALEVICDDDDNSKIISLGGIWDYRDDPEGCAFCDLSDDDSKLKFENVLKQQEKMAKSRLELLGFVIQPMRHKFENENMKESK